MRIMWRGGPGCASCGEPDADERSASSERRARGARKAVVKDGAVRLEARATPHLNTPPSPQPSLMCST
jgi:hypothetical protein